MRKLICFAIIALLICLAASCCADSLKFELETYKDPGSQLTMEIPKGWLHEKKDEFKLYLQSDLVAFGIFDLESDSGSESLTDLLPKYVDQLKVNRSVFIDLKMVEEPVMVSSARTKIAHAKISYKRYGTSNFVSDIYIIGGADGKACYGMVTYIPAGDQDAYRSLFEAVVRSITTDGSQSGSADFDFYKDTSGKFTLNVPKGWTQKNTDGMLFTMHKDNASFGVFDTGKGSWEYTPEDYLPFFISSFKNSDTFVDMQIIEKCVVMKDTRTPVAWSKVAHKLSGKDYMSYIYIVSAVDGKCRYGIVTSAPASEGDSYHSLFDSIATSVVVTDGLAASESVTKTEAEEPKPSKVTTYASSKALYWVRNESQIVKDGKVVYTSKAPIEHPFVSWDGKYIVYSKDQTKVVVLNISTGKETVVSKSSGDVTVKDKDGSGERDTIFPVGFSSDSKQVYFIRQASSVFVGGNKLFKVGIGGGKAEVVDVGVADAATSAKGDLLVLKPGNVQFVGKSGEVYDIDPEIRSIFVNGVGFSREGKPFYYSSDNIYLFNSKGTEKKIGLSAGSISYKPVVYGETAIWDDGRRIATNQDGAISQIGKQGSNRQPFM